MTKCGENGTPKCVGHSPETNATPNTDIGPVPNHPLDPNGISALALQAAASGIHPEPPKLADDMIIGGAAISEYVFGTASKRRTIYHWVHTDSSFPWSKAGGRICCLKSRLRVWVSRKLGLRKSQDD